MENTSKIANLESFSFEIYTENPTTGEGGWDIKFVRAFGKNKSEAIENVEKFPNFDTIITSTASYNGMPLDAEDIAAYADGFMFWEVDETLVN
jgi:hypothetical protein